jgi:hypothetical protein
MDNFEGGNNDEENYANDLGFFHESLNCGCDTT